MSAIQLHENCFGAVVGMPIAVCAVIPSLTYRPGITHFVDRGVHRLGGRPGTDPRARCSM